MNSEEGGYSSIAYCINVFVRKEIPCREKLLDRMIAVREIAFESIKRTGNESLLKPMTLIHMSAISLLNTALKEYHENDS